MTFSVQFRKQPGRKPADGTAGPSGAGSPADGSEEDAPSGAAVPRLLPRSPRCGVSSAGRGAGPGTLRPAQPPWHRFQPPRRRQLQTTLAFGKAVIPSNREVFFFILGKLKKCVKCAAPGWKGRFGKRLNPHCPGAKVARTSQAGAAAGREREAPGLTCVRDLG